ncbi:MAG TPA: cache domain-containing protein, partial [Bacillota bacterium]|nr:cache domain-containing protein [Bacillota bacterium]
DSDRLAETLKTGDRSGAVELGQTAMKSFEFDYMVITDTEGNVFVRAHDPDNYGDNIANQVNIQNALAGKQSVGIENGKVVKFSIRAGTPLRDSSGTMVGAISAGYVLGNNETASEFSKMLNEEVVIFEGDTAIASTVGAGDQDAINKTKLSKAASDTALGEGKLFYGPAKIAGENYIGAYVPLKDVSGKNAGVIFCGEKKSVITDIVREISMLISIVVLVLAALTVILLLLTVRSIVKPLKHLTEASRRVSEGDLAIALETDSRDEIGVLSNAFKGVTDNVTALIDEADTLTEAALEGNFGLRADAEKFKGSYQDIVKGLNGVMDSLEAYFNNLPTPVVIVGTDCRIRFINSAGERLWQKSASELLNTQYEALWLGMGSEGSTPPCISAIKEAAPQYAEMKLSIGEKTYEMTSTAVPIGNLEGAAIGAFEVIQDMTEIKGAFREAEKQRDLV